MSAVAPDIASIQAAVAARVAEEEAGFVEQVSGEQLHPLDLDVTLYAAARFLAEFPPSFRWFLHQSFMLGDLGLIVGPPGVGKSTLVLHILVAAAANLTALDVWPVEGPATSLYITAEDSEEVLYRRVYHLLKSTGLSEEEVYDAAGRMSIIPVRGDVAMYKNGRKTPSEAFIRRHIEAITPRPQVLALDTLSRFSGAEENDNASMTEFCAMLEEIAKDYGCNVILLHHTNKQAGDALDDPNEITKALSQTAIRGASALSGCARWVLTMAALGKKAAGKYFGMDGQARHPGSYIAVRVAKKNAGAPEPTYYFERGDNGILQRVTPFDDGTLPTVDDDARKLAEEVQRRALAGEKPLSSTRGGREAFGWGMSRSKKAADRAIELHLLTSFASGRGFALCTDVPPCTAEAGTKDINNDNGQLPLCTGPLCTGGSVL